MYRTAYSRDLACTQEKSKDMAKQSEKGVEAETKTAVAAIDTAMKSKEQEIMTV